MSAADAVSASAAERVRELLGLSPEQERLLELEGSAGLVAGAGAGKTKTLVGSVLWDLVVREISPERICVCTFTRASAAELRSRLEVEADRIERELGGRLSLEPIWLGTIDSICARLLHTSSIEAGVSPAISAGDERALRPLREEALERAADALSPEQLRELDSIVDWDAPEASGELARLLESWRASEIGGGIGLSTPVAPRPDLAALAAELHALTQLPEPIAAAAEEKLQAAASVVRALDEGAAVSELPELKLGRLRPIAAERWEGCRASYDQARAWVADELTLSRRMAARELLERWRAEYESSAQRAELADFSQLAHTALGLIRGGEGARFDRIYVDEAQDTSRIQSEILEGLRSEGGSKIIIGDANQSIYAWREADVEGFQRELSDLPRAELRDNYRSHPQIVEVVNELCAQVPALAPQLVKMRARRDSEPSREPRVEVWVPRAEGRALASVEREAEWAAPLIRDAASERGLSLSDVCVLVSSNYEVERYADALRAIGVPALAISKRGLLQRPEAADVIALLSALADSQNESALIRVLSSPIGALSLDQINDARSSAGVERSLWVGLEQTQPQLHRALCRARELASSPDLDAASAARAALAHLRYPQKLDHIDPTGLARRNTERVLSLVSEIESSSAGRPLVAIAAELERDAELGVDEPQDTSTPEGLAAVRVMTTHQAKGAEFPMVVSARMSRNTRAPAEQLCVSSRGELGAARKISGRSVVDSVLSEWRAREAETRADEIRRSSYVALTRARDWLIVIGCAKISAKGAASFSASFDELLGEALREEALTAEGAREVRVGESGELVLVRGGALGDGESTKPSPPAATELTQLEESPQTLGLPELRARRAFSYTAAEAWQQCGLRRYLERDLGLEGSDLDLGEGGVEGLAELAGLGGARERGARAHREIKQWINSKERPKSLSDEELSVLARELDLARGLAGEMWAERGFWVSDPILGETRGDLDLCVRTATESVIWDWKTGSEPHPESRDYSLQQKLYAWAELNSGAKLVRCRWVWLRTGAVEEREWAASELAELSKELREIQREIYSMPIVAAASSPQSFCVGCPGLEKICPVSKSARSARTLASDQSE